VTYVIELTKGKVTIVSDMSYEKVKNYKWYAENKPRDCYAVRISPMVNGRRHVIYMHRQILGLEYKDSKIADHINRITLDNRNENLRVVSKATNQRNCNLKRHNTSGINGVHWDKSRNKWLAFINFDNGFINLGRFVELNNAIEARKQAELKYWRFTR